MFRVTRIYPAPLSLSAKKSYSGEDVLVVLKEIFFDKCYLCEIKDPLALNVEHFVAHQGDLDLKFSWDNLYYVCGRCNNIKLADSALLLDCITEDRNLFAKIRHIPPHSPFSGKLTIEAVDGSKETISTATLLNKIFNSEHTINKTITAAYMRKKVYEKYNRLMEVVVEYFSDESSPKVKAENLEILKTLMGRHQEFSAFIRWIVLEDEKLFPLLKDFMD
ncbi:hypothetical protein [Pseudomonas sp. LB3P14]